MRPMSFYAGTLERSFADFKTRPYLWNRNKRSFFLSEGDHRRLDDERTDLDQHRDLGRCFGQDNSSNE
jgi:hypothetical protein